MINSLQENVKSTIQSLDSHSDLIGTLRQTLGSSIDKLEGIVGHIHTSLGMIEAIASASTQQSSAYDEINRSMHDMEMSFRGVTGSVSRMATESQEVRKFASSLKEVVS